MASPGYRRCPQDTAYPQDTDSVLRIPRYPQDTAGVLRYNCPHDAAVSSGYRVPRMPSVSQDANSRLQMPAVRGVWGLERRRTVVSSIILCVVLLIIDSLVRRGPIYTPLALHPREAKELLKKYFYCSRFGKASNAVYLALSRYAAIFGRAATRAAKATSLGKLSFTLGKRLKEKLVMMSKAPRSATWV